MRAQILRLFWLATVLFAAGFAVLSARVTGLLVARSLWQPETAPAGASALKAARPRVELLSDFRVVEDRNLFQVKPPPPPRPPEVLIPPPPSIEPPTAPPPPPPPPEPPLSLQVMATAVMDGGKSFAIVVAGGAGAPEMRVVKEGEEAATGAVLLAVRADRILVAWRGRTEEVMLTEGRGAPAGAGPRGRGRAGAAADRGVPVPPAGAAPGAAAPGAGESVRKVAEDRWVVEAREVDQLRDNMGSMMTQIRVVPNFAEGGQPDGFKVFAIRPGSLFQRIGLQNNDVIRRINGIEIQAPEQAMEAYQRLRDETSIQIEVVRQNQPKTLNYEIR